MRVGRIGMYKKIFSKIDLKVEVGNYNGIVIGPSSKIFNFISNLLNYKIIYPFLGFLNPKLFLVVSKPD